jgi:hypothetical protein
MPRKRDHFIDGIFNYCDRWCEHCEYTRRCRVCSDVEKAARRHELRGEDPNDMKVALQDVHRNFQRAMRMLVRGAKKFDIDLDEIAREAAKAPPVDHSRLDDHPLAKEGMAFFGMAHELVKTMGEDLGLTREDIIRRAEFMEVRGEADGLAKACQALEVLNWDASMVAVKLKRTIIGLFKDEDDLVAADGTPPVLRAKAGNARAAAPPQADAAEDADEEDDAFHLHDAEATAALVLRCLDRDKRALLALYDWNKDRQDAVIDLLAKAERITRALKKLLPGYKNHTFPPKTPKEK